jgi:hypothetical protein
LAGSFEGLVFSVVLVVLLENLLLGLLFFLASLVSLSLDNGRRSFEAELAGGLFSLSLDGRESFLET